MPWSTISHSSSLSTSCSLTSYSATKTWLVGSSTMVAIEPSQPSSSPPKVRRQPVIQPVPRSGECGHRTAIWSGSRFDANAAYRFTPDHDTEESPLVARVVIIGGGPGGYEAAHAAAQLGAEVTVVDSDGIGGSAVLTDCVPSKTLIATAEVMTEVEEAGELGVRVNDGEDDLRNSVNVDLSVVNARVKHLAQAQSEGISRRLDRDKVRVIAGRARLDGPETVVVGDERLGADVVLIATGARPRILAGSEPDGERILTWEQVYDLDALPERLIVVGSGVTGAEFASAYDALGSDVVLVSSRDRVLPGEDPDAAAVLEDVFRRRGMNVMARSRAQAAKRVGDRVEVTLSDGRVITGTHCLMAVGAIPNSEGMGLEEAGVKLRESGHIWTDKVSRTTAPGVYAAGDVTGVFALASVAAMQGRIAMYHFLGDAV